MPMLNCYVDERTLRALEDVSSATGRDVQELAEAAIADAAIRARTGGAPMPELPYYHGSARTHSGVSAIND